MISHLTAPRLRFAPSSTRSPAADDRHSRHLVIAAWGLLWLNVLTFSANRSIIPLPHVAGQAITQGALIGAFLFALSANRGLVLRPNVLLLLMSFLVADTYLTGLEDHYLSSYYRIVRFTLFVVTLWLLTPYWGRRDMLLVRCHLAVLAAVLGSVLLGVLAAPGRAYASGRLTGVIWPIAETQVAHYAAVLAGLVAMLWMTHQMRGPVALGLGLGSVAILLLTHTRTALLGLVVGTLVATLSMIFSNLRARWFLLTPTAVALLAAIAFSHQVVGWLRRGESAQELQSLTGRTAVWRALLSMPRDAFHEIFGFGLSNSSFNGLPVDSNWLTSYQEQGLFGVVTCAAVIVVLYLTAAISARGARRALALFLVTYCLTASFTEVGFANASPYLLDLVVAASLLLPSAASARQARSVATGPA